MLNQLKQWVFKKPPENANKAAKKEQLKNALALFIIAAMSYGFYWYSSKETQKPVTHEEPAFDGVFGDEFSQKSDEALIEKQQRQIDELKTQMNQKDTVDAGVKSDKGFDEKANAAFKSLEEKLTKLERANQQMNEKLQVALLKNSQSNQTLAIRPPTRAELEARRLQKEQAARELYAQAELETVRFNYKNKEKEERTPANFVWAGTFVEGRLITGIIGDAGINGSKNMGTALIELTSGGIMPNGSHSRLGGCFALVSTYGDLSGSSVVLHLETLSCAGKHINFEQKVYGAVYDLDAMQDLRGTSILKTKPLLEYSTAAGMIAGFGDGLKNYGSAQSYTPYGAMTTYPSAGLSIAQSTVGTGISNPANRVSEYIMRIADIYHPLVVARAGRRVSVLFSKGFWIDKAHQTYESGKSIDDDKAQQEAEVTTTVSGASNHEDSPQDNGLLMNGAPSPLMQSSQRAEQQFLQQQAPANQPLFSSVQAGESPHE